MSLKEQLAIVGSLHRAKLGPGVTSAVCECCNVPYPCPSYVAMSDMAWLIDIGIKYFENAQALQHLSSNDFPFYAEYVQFKEELQQQNVVISEEFMKKIG